MVDSASDINEFQAQELGVILEPITVIFGSEEYQDGVTLLPDEFYDKLFAQKDLPKTSQIPPYVFEERFEKETANGDTLIVITLSSRLSGTYNNAKTASERFGDKVFVVDSLTACAGERLLVLYALNLIKEGKSAREIVELLEKNKTRISVVAVIDTLEYLKKGGRISSAVAMIGTMLSIKPVLHVDFKGKLINVSKARGRKASLDTLFENMKKTIIAPETQTAFICHGDCIADAEYLANRMKTELGIPEVIIGYTGPVIAAHSGPGTLAIFYIGTER
jgi:DegV family protein with EDD domain